MPELPEVETVRRGLERLVVGRTIRELEIFYPKMWGQDLERARLLLSGQTIERIGRRGKYLLLYLTDLVLVSHLRMEGKYLFESEARPPRKHEHVFFHFEDGSLLAYQDVRKFGTMELLESGQLMDYFHAKKLGPEPTELEFAVEPFAAALSKSRKPIKSALLDQTLVAGLGNIYVDEVLWRAGIHPERTGASLTAAEVAAIHDQTIAVLQLGIARGGSTIRTYKNALGEDGTMQEELKVYGQTGQPCTRCGRPIEKTKVGGRGTHLCPQCQRRSV